MSDLFTLFDHLLTGPTEQVHFTISRDPAGGLTVLITPQLSAADPPPEEARDTTATALAQARAALALPLIVRATVAELDASLPTLLAEYTGQRESLSTSQMTLEELRQAAVAARTAVARQAAKTPPKPTAAPQEDGADDPAASTPTASAAAPVPAPLPATNPDSLF